MLKLGFPRIFTDTFYSKVLDLLIFSTFRTTVVLGTYLLRYINKSSTVLFITRYIKNYRLFI